MSNYAPKYSIECIFWCVVFVHALQSKFNVYNKITQVCFKESLTLKYTATKGRNTNGKH